MYDPYQLRLMMFEFANHLDKRMPLSGFDSVREVKGFLVDISMDRQGDS